MPVYSPSRFLDYALLYGVIFTSGTILFNWSGSASLILGALAGVTGLLFLRYVGRIDGHFLLYIFGLSAFLFCISIYTNESLPFSTIVSTDLRLIYAYMALKLVGDRIFVSYLNVMVFLAAFSLFGFAADLSGISASLHPFLPHLSIATDEGFLYGFNFFQHPTRNNSIFYEPGAYQFFLNAGIFMLLFARVDLPPARRSSYLVILAITLISTISTTGLIMFAAIFVVAMFQKSSLSSRAKFVFLIGVSMVPLVFVSQMDYALKKFDSYTGIRAIADKADLRPFDLLVDTAIIKENFFGLGERRYHQRFSDIGLISETYSSSNGVTKLTAIFGVPFALFYFGTYAFFFVRFLPGWLLPGICFSAFMVFLWSESYYSFSPICLTLIAAIFVFPRKRDSRNSVPSVKQTRPVNIS